MARNSYMNPKKRSLSKSDKLAINRAGQRMLIQEIEELEQRAHRLGMSITAHAINRAKNALGWEMAGDTHQAHEAAFDRRPGK